MCPHQRAPAGGGSGQRVRTHRMPRPGARARPPRSSSTLNSRALIALHALHRLAGDDAGALGAHPRQSSAPAPGRKVGLGAFALRFLLGDDGVDDGLFALQAADAGGRSPATTHCAGRVVAVPELVEVPDRALLGVAGIGAAHARRVGGESCRGSSSRRLPARRAGRAPRCRLAHLGAVQPAGAPRCAAPAARPSTLRPLPLQVAEQQFWSRRRSSFDRGGRGACTSARPWPQASSSRSR